jgi:hypothetical protein
MTYGLHALFDHVIGKREHLRWYFQTECLRALEIDDQLDFRDLHDRQVGGLFTLENATCIKSDLSVLLYQARYVTDEAARYCELTKRVHGRNRIACRSNRAYRQIGAHAGRVFKGRQAGGPTGQRFKMPRIASPAR